MKIPWGQRRLTQVHDHPNDLMALDPGLSKVPGGFRVRVQNRFQAQLLIRPAIGIKVVS